MQKLISILQIGLKICSSVRLIWLLKNLYQIPILLNLLIEQKPYYMDIEIKKYLFDIKESIDSIEAFLGDKLDFNLYMADKMLRRAVEREFEIIGEAMSRIEKSDPSIEILSKRQIISMRNRVIHGYDKIDNEIIWGTIVRHLPILKQEINELLRNDFKLL